MKICKGNYRDHSGIRPIVLALALVVTSISPLIPYEAKIVLFAVLSCVMIPHAKTIRKDALYFALPFAAVVLLSFTNDLVASIEMASSTLSFYYIPVCLAIGYLISCTFDMNHFLSSIEKFMFPLTIASLVIFTIIFAAPNLAQMLPTYTFGDLPHRTAVLANVIYAEGFLMHRNPGFASEPGVFQILLNFSLYQVVRTKGLNNIRTLVYLLGLLTGTSTVGMFIAVIILIAFSSNRGRILIVIVGLAISPLIAPLIVDQIETKLIGSSAFDNRFIPALNAFNTIIENPFGIGALQYDLRYTSEEFGSFDAYTQISLRYGIQGLAVLVFPLFFLYRKNKAISIILALSYFAQPFWYLPIFSSFIWWGILGSREEKSVRGHKQKVRSFPQLKAIR